LAVLVHPPALHFTSGVDTAAVVVAYTQADWNGSLCCAVVVIACAVVVIACAVIVIACAVIVIACAVIVVACAVVVVVCAVVVIACAVVVIAIRAGRRVKAVGIIAVIGVVSVVVRTITALARLVSFWIALVTGRYARQKADEAGAEHAQPHCLVELPVVSLAMSSA
jgi:hypothetical protein